MHYGQTNQVQTLQGQEERGRLQHQGRRRHTLREGEEEGGRGLRLGCMHGRLHQADRLQRRRLEQALYLV